MPPASLPPTLDVPDAGKLLGRSAAYDLIKTGRWPTPVLHLGRRIRIPTAPLLALLGLHGEATGLLALSSEKLAPSPTGPALPSQPRREIP